MSSIALVLTSTALLGYVPAVVRRTSWKVYLVDIWREESLEDVVVLGFGMEASLWPDL